jgi:cytochrome c-type biogenesis protein CcmF
MIQEKRGMLKTWNASLALATGTLAVLGTFLVRSGILDSIHAFGASTLGTPFLVLIGIMVAGSVGLVVWRRETLRSDHRLDSLLSREAVFLVQNVVLVGLCFAIFWGTFFPLISEALTGTRHSLGPPWFDRYTVPLALILVLLTGVGPLIAWRRATPGSLRRSFALPAGVGALALVLIGGLTGAAAKPLALTMFGIGAFVLTCVGQELWRGTRARRAMSGEAAPLALLSLVRRNRRRYGGYTVHAGLAVLFVGVAASSSFQKVTDVALKPGQSASVKGYDVRYVRPTTKVTDQDVSLGAVLDVTKDGKHVTTLRTQRRFFADTDLGPFQAPVSRFFGGEPTSEVGLDAGATRDIWTDVDTNLAPLQHDLRAADRRFEAGLKKVTDARSLNAFLALRYAVVQRLAHRWISQPWAANFRFEVSPLVTWIWVGGLIMIGGALIALWPVPEGARRRVSAAYAARLGRELAQRTA